MSPPNPSRPAPTRRTIPPVDALASARPGRAGHDVLSHPLPAGMRDLLPADAAEQGRLASIVLRSFQLHGFQRVTMPAFEYAEVLERGLGHVDANSMLRFVEPETGEVVALRPDMTPQVARLVSTRLANHPSPARLSYRGSVLRRRHERARHEQQMQQAGIELVGLAGIEGDLEVLRTATAAVRAAGLDAFVLDVGHGRIAASLLEQVDPGLRDQLLEPLAQKDEAELVRRAERGGVAPDLVRALAALPHLHGGPELREEARTALANTGAVALADELFDLVDQVLEQGLAPAVVADLGETRAFAYYTGPMFQILAEGPGQAVGSGGRYDGLYAQFGLPRPAAGFAMYVDNLRWALGSTAGPPETRVLVVGDGAASARMLEVLRAAEIPSASAPATNPLDYARAWRYSHVVRPSGHFDDDPVEVSRVTDDREEKLGVVPLSRVPTRLSS